MTIQIDSVLQTVIITAVIAVIIQKFQRLRQDNQRRDHDTFVSDSLIETVANVDDEKSILKIFENIDYFDSRRENEKNTKIIVNVDRHVYYKNVFVFIDRLKNFEKKSFDHRVREFIVECLREDVIIWHELKLKAIEKNMYRDVFVNQWCKRLIRRFKERDSQILKNLQVERYNMQNARNDKTFKVYVQNIMRHFFAIEFNFTYNQLIMTWNNLNFEFKMQIFESTTTTTLVFFFDFLNVKVNVWHEMIMIRRFVQHFVNVNVDKRQISKQSNQERQNDYQQQFDVDDFQFSYSYSYVDWSSFDYNSHQYQYSAYQNNVYQKYQKFQYQFSNVSKTVFVAFVLSVDRQSFQFIFENAFDSKIKNQSIRRQTSEKKQSNRDEKTRVFVVDEEDEEKKFVESFNDEKKFHSEQKHEKYYVTNENLKYYNIENENEIFVNFILSSMTKSFLLRCRRCRKTFTFNNILHAHLRVECEILSLATRSRSQKIEIYSAESVNSIFSSIDVTKRTESMISISVEFIVIRSNVDFVANVDFDYDFREWNYVKIKISLSSKASSDDVCLNIDANVSLVDRTFFKAQISNIFIRIMISFLKIRELNINRHETWKYVICDIRLSNIIKNDKLVVAFFRREIHLMNNLKINMLINNDIIDFEDFDINMIKKQTIIESIDVIISLKIRSFKSAVQKSIHLKKIIVVSSHAAMIVVVHHVDLSVTRNFLFESNDDFNLIMYAHFIDVDIKCVLIRNDKNVSIMIFRNYRLDRIFELDFSNVFHIDSYVDDDVTHLTIKKFKTIHKNEWFKKFIFVCVVIYVVVVAIEISFSTAFVISSTVIILSKAFHLSQIFVFEKLFAIAVIEIVLFSDVTIYNSESSDFFAKIVKKFSTLWHDIDFVKMSKENWMRISLKSDWEKRISDKAKVYSLEVKDRKLMNKIFDELHRVDKMFWTNQFISFFYLCFCVWKTVEDERKNRVVVDIRNLNAITQSNVYSLFLQIDIIVVVRDCKYIFVIDCSAFFYQWRVHLNDRHKLIVINHRDQKSFNVTMMKYKNSFAYVQRQIDRFFRKLRKFVRTYVNDIVIFSCNKIEHETHLRDVFKIFVENNVSIKSTKTFLNYFFVFLLNQKIDSLNLIISKEKLRAIFKFRFFRIFRQLETYLNLTDWLRNYIFYYVEIFKSFQNRKIDLLRNKSTADSARKVYSFKIRVQYFIVAKLISFDVLHIILRKFFYFVHSNIKRQFFIDLDVSKKFDFEIMLYYVKKVYFNSNDKYFLRHAIELVLFFSRFLIDAKTRYWFTELEIANIVWILKKIRHIIEISFDKTIVYIDHDSALDIVAQTTMTIISIDKLNLRLIRAFDYIQRFNLNIRHKFDKQHIVFDALSRLVSDNINASTDRSHDESELNVLFTVLLMKMNEVFRNRILKDYKKNLNWQKIIEILNNDESVIILFFYREKKNTFDENFIFRSNDFTIDDHVYEFCRLCIFHSIVQNIFQLIYDDDHFDYVKCFEQMFVSYYIRDLFRYLRDYLKHCSNCQIYQIKKHAFYEFMQSILTSSISFHIIIIDFILILFLTSKKLDISMSIICKHTKRFILIVDKKIWFASEWNMTLIDRFDIADWNISKIIISDKDRKFLSNMWTVIFKKLNVRLLYSIVYHFQIDDQSERINQMIEITLRFHLIRMINSIDWSKIFSKMQRHFNNSHSTIIEKTLNEVFYDFIFIQSLNVLRQSFVIDLVDELKEFSIVDSRKSLANAFFSAVTRTRFEIADVIAFAQMINKHYYDRKYQFLFMKADEYALIRLHRDYDISFIEILDSKLSQRYIDSFKILENVDNLIYRLKFSKHWRIHFVFSVIQLKSTLSFSKDFFHKSRSNHSNSIHVENDIKLVKSWEIERLINKREIKRRESEYLIRWKSYESQYDEWRNLFELRNAQKLVQNYEKTLRFTFFLFDRLQISITSSTIKASKTKKTKSFDEITSKKLFNAMTVRNSFMKFYVSFTSIFITIIARKSFAESHVSSNEITTSRASSASEFFVDQRFVVVVRKFFAISFTLSSTFVSLLVDQLIRRFSRLHR